MGKTTPNSNRLLPNTATDTWLTPLGLLEKLGKFDLDPCCPPVMPWKTAKRMVCLPEDGLTVSWRGRVFLNPPYSDPMPWLRKMHDHRNGIALVPAKSPDTKWGQLALSGCDAVLFLSGRLLFFKEDGSPSEGKWNPNMLLAYGAKNVKALSKLEQSGALLGTLFIKPEKEIT